MSKPLRIGLAIPLQGPGGIFGPSCEAVATLAATHLNAGTGILHREVEIEVIDVGGTPTEARRNVVAAVRERKADAITGWHISSVRDRVAPVLGNLCVPYIYTSLHEGTAAGSVLSTGETPADQVVPGVQWLRKEFGVKRWAMIGSSYIWPLDTARQVRDYARARDLDVVYESFVPYGSEDFSRVLAELAASPAQGVIMLLVGRDAVLFNRQFAAAGLQDKMLRFTPLMEENMLLASGSESTRELYVAAAYFSSLATQSALDFAGAYGAEFGVDGPALNNAAESCYEGVLALAAVATRARSLDVRAMLAAAADGFAYEGPRGRVMLADGGSHQRVHLARAEFNDFSVLASLDPARTG